MDDLLQTPSTPPSSGGHLWRSLDEREETPLARQAAQEEFLPGSVDPALSRDTRISRRNFMGLVAAASALAGTAACSRRKKGTIVPYTKRPSEVVPGVATYYATTFPEGPRAYPVLVKTREGRPIHVEGNDEHPTLQGKTSPRAVADILRLYDPDRLRAPKTKDGSALSWPEAERRLVKAFGDAKAAGKPVLLLTGALASPTTRAWVQQLQRALPTLEHLAWEPAAGDAAQTAAVASYGRSFCLRPRLEDAKVILSLGADFLNGEDPEAIRAFTAKRRQATSCHDALNRLWVLEGALSLTGQNADQRFPLAPSRLASVALALAKSLAPQHPELQRCSLPDAPPIPRPAWTQLLEELRHAGSRAVVLCGASMPVEVHRAAHLLNQVLDSKGVEYLPSQPLATHRELEAVAQKLKAGTYAAVLFWGVNPVYAHPHGELWQDALARTPFKAWLGLMEDETSSRCDLCLPESHWLEAWGDFEWGPARLLQQPTIAPLYDTRQGEEVLLALLRGLGQPVPAEYHLALQARWQKEVHPAGSLAPFERFWQAALHDGLVRLPSAPTSPPTFQGKGLGDLTSPPASSQGFELLLLPSPQLLDGRYANNGWLQELPDPVTKTAWGNPLAVSVADAKALNLKDGDQVQLKVGERTLLLPVVVQPGQAKGVLTLALGHGRAMGGVAKGIGTNGFPLLDPFSDSPNLRMGVTLVPTGRRVDVPRTQGHHRMEGRDLARVWTPEAWAHHATHPHAPHALHTLYPDLQFPEHRWGMVIDLAACVGCSACVLACGSENNVPVVGPEQVARGREMHWIRIDRYYEGDPENPRAVHQPMLCQHCDHAPCENVCPVNATNHSPDGLNQMAYNRCVGTRYCANNCPYKVRRFNFLEYTADKQEPESLVYNPEVTVRPRGVMEKCTFCVQRIQDARMRAKAEQRPVRDGDIAPACAVACPGDAIVFGDLKDPDSRVSRLIQSGRSYKVLEELGARPAITYLAKLRNPGGEEGHAHA